MDNHKFRMLLMIAHNGDYQFTPDESMDRIFTEDPHVAALNVRMLPYAKEMNSKIIMILNRFAEKSDSKLVRREVASAALAVSDRYDVSPVLRALMTHANDAADPLIPHLTWLAYEKVLVGKPDAAVKELAWLAEQAPTNLFVRDRIVPKAVRRLASTGKPTDLELCLKFVADCTDLNTREKALDGLSLALAGQTVAPPAGWATLQAELAKEPRLAGSLAKLNVSFRDVKAVAATLKIAADADRPIEMRLEAMRRLAAGKIAADDILVPIVKSQQDTAVRVEAARTLSASVEPKLAERLLTDWVKYPAAVQAELVNLFAGRKPWAVAMLKAMESTTLDRRLVTDNTILRIQSFNDADLNKLIEKAWGRTRTTPAELTAVIDTMRTDLGKATASFARGKVVFEAQCAKCHQFEGRGQLVGPPLDGAARDIEYLLANIIDPNRVIGAPYFLRIVNTLDGKVEQGVLAEEDERFLTLKIENGVLRKIAKADIDGDVKIVEKSMMPEGLAYAMSVQDFRDLVRYVMASPYLTAVTVDGKATSVPVTGRIPLAVGTATTIEVEFTAAADLKTQLLLGIVGPYEVRLDGKILKAGDAPKSAEEGIAVPVSLSAGKHKLVVILKKSGAAASLRLIDSDRKLTQPN